MGEGSCIIYLQSEMHNEESRKMKARDMGTQQYIDWDQRRAAICRAEAGVDRLDSDLRLYRALAPVDGLPSYTVAQQVANDINVVERSGNGSAVWAIY